jgi:hypothetical protein
MKLRLNAKWCGQQAEWQRDGEVDDFQHSVDGNAYDAKWEQKKPDEGIGDERKQGQGPAQNEEDAPEQEREHGGDLPLAKMIVRPGRGGSSVPGTSNYDTKPEKVKVPTLAAKKRG